MVAAGRDGRVRATTSALREFGRRWRRRALATRERVPALARTLSELARVEVVDRSTAIGAQALLALIPMLVVLTAFFPHLVGEGAERFAEISGVGDGGAEEIQQSVAVTSTTVAAADQVRAATGFVGALVIIFSASSFARSLQRFYERLWELPHIGGVVARRRCLSWLVGWLASLLVLSLVSALAEKGGPLVDLLWSVVRWALLVLIWWWTTWVLLLGRLPWARAGVPALVCASLLLAYSQGATVVMPRYVTASADQFGSLGVVLAVATWLVGMGGVLVVGTTVGKVASEDPRLRALAARGLRSVRRRDDGAH